MIAPLAAALLGLSSPFPGRSLSTDCRLVAANDKRTFSLFRVYTGRQSLLVAVEEKTYLEVRYDAYADRVLVTVLMLPHAPWSFGEKVLAKRRALSISRSRTTQTSLAVEGLAFDARLECR